MAPDGLRSVSDPGGSHFTAWSTPPASKARPTAGAVGVDRLREAGVAAKVVKGLHASIGVPNEGSRADEIVSKREIPRSCRPD